jgi:hypothetical protein
MHLQVGQFSDEELAAIAGAYNHMAGRDDLSQRWRAWGREMAEALGLELAQRMIGRAEQDDPMGWCWFGRLPTAEEPGRWEQGA